MILGILAMGLFRISLAMNIGGISEGMSGDEYISYSEMHYLDSFNFAGNPDAAADDNVKKLINSTLLGGLENDYCSDIAVDSSGCSYVVGSTPNSSKVFPTTSGAFDEIHNGGIDVFVAKISADGSSLLYSTFLGGPGDEEGYSIAVDSSGCAYITGYTNSTSGSFPTTSGAINETENGDGDAFVAKIRSRYKISWSNTYL